MTGRENSKCKGPEMRTLARTCQDPSGLAKGQMMKEPRGAPAREAQWPQEGLPGPGVRGHVGDIHRQWPKGRQCVGLHGIVSMVYGT